MGAACLVAGVACVAGVPSINVQRALQLSNATRENFASRNQAMNVWPNSGTEGKELVVALTHEYNNFEVRGDDREFVVAWESDGSSLVEVARINISCPNNELVVPNRGPYVYEARLDLVPGVLHPECSCVSSSSSAPCPRGVNATTGDSWLSLMSPIVSHFVTIENEWSEIRVGLSLDMLATDIVGEVQRVSEGLTNATTGAASEAAAYACPGTYDDLYGQKDVTKSMLEDSDMTLPSGHVTGKWCLVQRGRCTETAKVKVCELSGAIGTIIVDHGEFPYDQVIEIRVNEAASETLSTPTLFLSESEGQLLASGTSVHVGPSVGGPPPPTYSPGSGIRVHALGINAPNGEQTIEYPDLFGTAGWLEASDVRDLLFVCLPDNQEVRIYNISQPLVDISFVGSIPTWCRRSGLHDYRVLDFLGGNGRYHTALIDPFDWGNRLFYFDTHDPSTPFLIHEVVMRMESDEMGLGQVRSAGPENLHHIVTWHCSNFMCGDNIGDSLYVLNTSKLTQTPFSIPLPLSSGGVARDVACGPDHLCLVSLTWDGVVALDSGVGINQWYIVAQHVNKAPFSSAELPFGQTWLRLYSGAQKVYASIQHARHFYVEHADFDLQPFMVNDNIRALQMRDIYIVAVEGYDSSQFVDGPGVFVTAPQGYKVVSVRDELFSFSEGDYQLSAYEETVFAGEQYRAGRMIWSGDVQFFVGEGMAQGRREPYAVAAAGQWAVDDVVYVPAIHSLPAPNVEVESEVQQKSVPLLLVLVASVIVLCCAAALVCLLLVVLVKFWQQSTERIQEVQGENVVLGRPVATGAEGTSDVTIVCAPTSTRKGAVPEPPSSCPVFLGVPGSVLHDLT